MNAGRIPPEDVLDACDAVSAPGEPVTANEIAEKLGCTRRTAYNKLDELADRGDVQSKKVGARCRVWWQSTESRSATDRAFARTCARETASAATGSATADTSERQLLTLIDNVPGMVYRYRNERGWPMEFVSDACRNLTGYDPGALERGDVVWGEDVIVEADREAVWVEIQATVTDREPFSVTYRIETADGDVRWLRDSGRGVFDDGSLVEIEGILFDVTERKRLEADLAESERRYRTFVENFPNGSVGLFDEDLRYVAVGGSLVDELDISPEERVGKRIFDIHSDDLLAEVEPHFRAALEGESNSFEVEYRGRHLFAQTVPVGDGDEVDAGMLVVQDVTDRWETERELRESEAKFRMLAENLNEIVWMASADADEFLYLNPEFEEVWGLDREQLYDEPLSFLEAVHPDDRDRVRDAFAALPEREFDHEFRIIRPDGEVRWVHAQGARVTDEDGPMDPVIGIGEDITERRERERRLEKSERRYRTLAEHFPNGAVGVYDHDLRYTLTKGAVLGDRLPSADRLEGNRVVDIFPPETVSDLEPLFRAAVEEGETDSTTTQFGGRDWRVWAAPLRDADGDIFAGLSFA